MTDQDQDGNYKDYDLSPTTGANESPQKAQEAMQVLFQPSESTILGKRPCPSKNIYATQLLDKGSEG